MQINVFADTICGWCFIGHKNLSKALKNFPNIKFDIRHIPFQLNPDMPARGILRDKYLEIKFGGKDYAAPMYENMKLKAKESGINLNLDKIKKTPNTVLSHLLIILSEQFNLQNEVKEKIYQSYFIVLQEHQLQLQFSLSKFLPLNHCQIFLPQLKIFLRLKSFFLH